MAAEYEVRIYSREGVLRERILGMLGHVDEGANNGWISLSYTKEVNGCGNGIVAFNAESAAVTQWLAPNGVIELDTQVEIWRRDRDEGIGNYADFYGLLRDHEYSTDDNGIVTYVAYLDEQQDWLRRSIVAYRADTANRSLFENVAAETVLKTLVTYNATSAGTTADGRDTNVGSWGANISVKSDGAEGSNVTVSCAGRNLLEILREVADLGGLDFGLTKTGPQAWQFWTDTRMGDNHTDDVVFSLPYGNMRRPRLRSNRRAEKTVAIVGGQDTGSSRAVEVRTGANYNASYNSFETFVNASQYSDAAGLQSEGDARLEELRAVDQLSFDVIQVSSTLYGKHYRLGDTVSAYFRGFAYTPKIMRVMVDVRHRGNQSPEQIEVVLNDG